MHIPAAILAVVAALPASADAATRTWTLPAFQSVQVYGGNDVEVQAGPGWRVVAEGDEDDLGSVRVSVAGGRLMLVGGSDLKLTVVAPEVTRVSTAGSGTISWRDARGPNLELSVAGSGGVRLGTVTAQALSVSVAGSGEVKANGGQCDHIAVSVAGSGEARLERIATHSVAVQVMGSGAVAARADGNAAVRAVGSSAVRIYGRPRCTISKAGSAQVYCE
ncbi:MAG: DUF2807 domain-containing protein [Sphingomonadaceae bacterium]|nr:DUF2807 domain-containing protein [Sphingomonadaceae bacterium]